MKNGRQVEKSKVADTNFALNGALKWGMLWSLQTLGQLKKEKLRRFDIEQLLKFVFLREAVSLAKKRQVYGLPAAKSKN